MRSYVDNIPSLPASARYLATFSLRDSMACRDGQDHRSLSQLLKDLEKQADGAAPSTDDVGSSVSRPLHVVVQVCPVPYAYGPHPMLQASSLCGTCVGR